MRSFSIIYYLLFVIMIFGAFASMAQNDYGITVLGLVALAFALIFLLQLIFPVKEDKSIDTLIKVELISLVTFASILSMRVFYIRFPFVEIVFGLAGILLVVCYLFKFFQSWVSLSPKSKLLAYQVSAFFASIIFYILSMTIVPFIPILAEPAGMLAFSLLLLFAVFAYLKRDFLLDGEKISSVSYVFRLNDRSVVLTVLFLLFTAYMGLMKVNAIPRMYSDEYPQAYFELVKQAEAGEEKPVDGKYKHEEFKKMYDQFVSRNNIEDQK